MSEGRGLHLGKQVLSMAQWRVHLGIHQSDDTLKASFLVSSQIEQNALSLQVCPLQGNGSKHAHTPQVKYIIAILCTNYVHGCQAYFVLLITDMVAECLPEQGPVAIC